MDKKKTNNEAAEAQVAPAAIEQSQEASQTQSEQPAEIKHFSLVICAYPRKEELVRKIWDKFLPEVEKKIITVEEEIPVQSILAELIADITVADKFVFVPAVAIPCAKLSYEELQLPVVFKDVNGNLHFNNRLPVYIDKETMADILGRDVTNNSEAIMKQYAATRGRAVEAAFKEGNFVTPVLRGNPCEHIVMEGLVRKKYLITNPAGLEAITPLLLQTLLDE